MISAATTKGQIKASGSKTLKTILHTSPSDPGGSEGDSQRPTEGEDMLFDGPDMSITKISDLITYSNRGKPI